MTTERVLVFALAVVSTLAAGLAAGLAADGSRAPALSPRRLVVVIAANVLALPLATWLALRAASLEGPGLVLAAAAPGGSTGPLLALLGRADARVAAVSFLALALAGTASALVATIAVDVAGLAAVAAAGAAVLATSVVPLVAGLALRARRPTRAAAWQPWLSRAGLALLVATIAVLARGHGDAARAADVAVGGLVTVAALAIGLVVTGRAARIAVAQVSAVRNLTLALVVLAATGAPPAASLSVLGYGLAMYVVTGAAAAWWRSAKKDA